MSNHIHNYNNVHFICLPHMAYESAHNIHVYKSNATPHMNAIPSPTKWWKCHPSTIKVAARQLVRCNQLPIHRLPKEVANVANTLDTKSQFPPIMHHNGSQLPHCVHGHHLSQCMWLASITTCKSIHKEGCHPYTCTCDILNPSPHIKGLTTIHPRHVASLAKPSSAKISNTTMVRARVRETFELNQLKSTPSQLLPVFSGFWPVANLLPSIWTGQYIYFFFQVPVNFFFKRPRTWALISKLAFQCSKIMKCNNEAKASPVRHSPNRYKSTTER